MKTRKEQFVIILFWRGLFVINPYNYYILPFFSSLYNLRLQYLSSTMLFLLVFVLFFFCFAILATWFLVFSFKIEGKVTSLAIHFFLPKQIKNFITEDLEHQGASLKILRANTRKTVPLKIESRNIVKNATYNSDREIAKKRYIKV